MSGAETLQNAITEVVREWNTIPLKAVSEIYPSNIDKKSSDDEESVRLCNYTDVYYNEEITDDIEFMEATTTEAKANRFRLREGDILITKDSESKDDIGIPAYVPADFDDVVCGYHLFLIRPDKSKISPRFLFSCLKSRLLQTQFENLASGVTRYGITTGDAKNVRLPHPNKEVQNEITSFIDENLSGIDEAIESLNTLENRLEERRETKIRKEATHSGKEDTGTKETEIPWLGRIPEDWEVAKVGWKYDIQLGKMLDESDISGEHLYPYLRNKDVQWWDVNTDDLPQMDFSPDERSKYQLKEGDVLVCEGGEAGRSAVWRGDDDEIYYQKALHRVRPIGEDQDSEFFCYFMEFAVKAGLFSSRANQSTIEHVTVEKLSDQKMPIPPREQQEKIAKKLSESVENIEKSIDSVKKLQEVLEEKRKALITAAVTGQIDVSDVKIEAKASHI